MKQVPSREFQKAFSRITEPCQVTSWGDVIGTYYPKGTEPVRSNTVDTLHGTLTRVERNIPDPVQSARDGGRERDSWLSKRGESRK